MIIELHSRSWVRQSVNLLTKSVLNRTVHRARFVVCCPRVVIYTRVFVENLTHQVSRGRVCRVGKKVCPRFRGSACWRSGEITQPRTNLFGHLCKSWQTHGRSLSFLPPSTLSSIDREMDAIENIGCTGEGWGGVTVLHTSLLNGITLDHCTISTFVSSSSV